MATLEKAKKAKKTTTAKPKSASRVICLPDRDSKITEMAYFKAERRGFEPGRELDDWLEAEQEFSL